VAVDDRRGLGECPHGGFDRALQRGLVGRRNGQDRELEIFVLVAMVVIVRGAGFVSVRVVMIVVAVGSVLVRAMTVGMMIVLARRFQ
jgi:hypothetical protein